MSRKKGKELPTITTTTMLANNRMALRIAPPRVSPETVISQFRRAGYDVSAYAPVLKDGKVVAVDVICVVHDGKGRTRTYSEGDDDE